MLAALATCLFVIYLYRTLNQDYTAEPNEQPDPVEGSVSWGELDRRINSLQSRLQSLADQDHTGRTSS